MSLQMVLSSIVYWNEETPPWDMLPARYNSFSSITSLNFQSDFENLITILYNGSDRMQELFESLVTTGTPIRVAESKYEPGLAQTLDPAPYDGFTGFNFSLIAANADFNDKGEWIQWLPELIVAHEFSHLYRGTDDIANTDANAANYDNKGDTVRYQNLIAGELGYSDAQRSSYASSGHLARFQAGASYTQGEAIDISRVGNIGPNNLDTSTRTDASRDLLFGQDAADTINSGAGNDHLYGLGGADTINAGSGDDHIYGGLGDDVITGRSGNDTMWGGDDDDVLNAGSGDDFLVGDSGNDVLVGGAGNDELWGGSYGEETSNGIDTANYSGAAKRIKIVLGADSSLRV